MRNYVDHNGIYVSLIVEERKRPLYGISRSSTTGAVTCTVESEEGKVSLKPSPVFRLTDCVVRFRRIDEYEPRAGDRMLRSHRWQTHGKHHGTSRRTRDTSWSIRLAIGNAPFRLFPLEDGRQAKRGNDAHMRRN